MRGIIMGTTEFPAEERVGDHKYDQVTADNPISRKKGRSYFQLIPAVQEKYTRVSKFNMNKFSGWKWKRRRMDRIHSL